MSILTDKSVKKLGLEVFMALCIMAFTGLRARSQTLFGPEYHVKAAFIYNFAKFVEWPQDKFDNNNDPVILCISSNNPQINVFFSLNNKTVGGKKMAVRKCEDLEDIKDCHILFLDSTDKEFIRENLKSVKEHSILTVGHIKGFTQMGGIINFFTVEDRLKFEVNLDAAKRSGLKLGSQLLMSAEIVTQEHK